MRLSRRSVSVAALITLAVLTACGGAPPAIGAAKTGASSAKGEDGRAEGEVASSADAAPAKWSTSIAPGEALPVTDADPVWGDPDAPVTIVAFEDLECPFCARSSETLAALMRRYGPHDLRIAFKHFPLDRHPGAREAAELGAAIQEVGGPEAFFAYAGTVFAEVLTDHDGEVLGNHDGDFVQMTVDGLAHAQSVRPMSVDALKQAMATSARRKVDADLALAKAIGATGTPTFYINGVGIHGADREEVFAAIIDDELRLARGGRDGAKGAEGGVAAKGEVYAKRLAANIALGKAKEEVAPPKKPEPPDTVVHYVPLDGSPTLGKATALVTIVEFADFDCPSCTAVRPTLDAVTKKYGDKVRLVFKEMPPPSHARAEPAAELAAAIFKKKGNAAFWKAERALFDPSANVDDDGLGELAKGAGLDEKATLADISAKRYFADIGADLDLADDLAVDVSPQFFVNGKRLRGNVPVDAFEGLVDAELAGAEARVTKGTKPAAVYDAIMKDAERPKALETKHAPAIGKGVPTRGPATAPVTIQVFGDFQCPYCKKLQPTLQQVERDFPGKVRFVFRELPLPFHADAMPAAKGAVEAGRQKGDKGFWAFHDAVYAAQGTVPDAIKRAALEKMATDLGLDMTAFDAALDAPDPPAAITDDAKIASDLDIRGTPTVLVNDFVIVGAQPVRRFEKLVRRALSGKPSSRSH